MARSKKEALGKRRRASVKLEIVRCQTAFGQHALVECQLEQQPPLNCIPNRVEICPLIVKGFTVEKILDSLLPLHHTEEADEPANEGLIASGINNSSPHCISIGCPMVKRFRS